MRDPDQIARVIVALALFVLCAGLGAVGGCYAGLFAVEPGKPGREGGFCVMLVAGSVGGIIAGLAAAWVRLRRPPGE
jgi:hypothetical protein